jgi:hypothetical protein
MNCSQWQEELRSWLEGRWESMEKAVPKRLEEHAAECSGCAARLSAALLLVDGEGLRKAPPEGLSQRVSERLVAEDRPKAIPWMRWTAIPVAALLLVAVTFFLTKEFVLPARSDTVIVRLMLEAPNAREVSVVGDWNGWDPAADRLTDRDGDGIWEIEIRLQRGGEHQYQFLIDREQWVADPEARLRVEDGFGGFNSILQI